jgi:linoleate 10R-lipoxygenase
MLPNTFAEDHLVLLPPAVCVLLMLFNRNHNVRPRRSNFTLILNCRLQYIANKLLEINKHQTYTKLESIPLTDPDHAKKIADQDEDNFQTTQLINYAGLDLPSSLVISAVFLVFVAKAARGV